MNSQEPGKAIVGWLQAEGFCVFTEVRLVCQTENAIGSSGRDRRSSQTLCVGGCLFDGDVYYSLFYR
jgi:hypothetical protein